MRKLTIHPATNIKKAKKLAKILGHEYGYDVAVCTTDDIMQIVNKSNNRWDDILISLNESEDNYTYIYFWENGTKEMDLAACIAMHVNSIPNPIPSTNFLVSHADAIYCNIEIGKETDIKDIAEGIHAFFQE